MKTGKQVLIRAMQLLNLTDSSGRVNAQKNKAVVARGLPFINQIGADLAYLEGAERWSEAAGMDDPLPLSGRALDDVMPYGVAMLIAQSEGDISNQSVFASLYNQKRAGLGQSGQRGDVIPGIWS